LWEELMDEAVIGFRQAADEENRHRPERRRYSPALQLEAVAYWRQQRGDHSVRTIAVTLGVSVTTLQRWTRGAGRRPRFRPVAVVERPRSADAGAVTIQITAAGPRVDGLTVESAARLLTLLR
jgi:transposase-like protein